MTRTRREKVVAYVTHGDRLLVFRHADLPEAGIQVPAGTVEAEESAEAAVLREAREETGLDQLSLVRFLGSRLRDFGTSEIHNFSFFHLRCDQTDPPTAWTHYETTPSDGGGPVRFDLHWVPLKDIPELAGEQGCLLDALKLCTELG